MDGSASVATCALRAFLNTAGGLGPWALEHTLRSSDGVTRLAASPPQGLTRGLLSNGAAPGMIESSG